MAIAVSARETVDVVLDDDLELPESERTTFKLAGLKRGQYMEVMKSVAPLMEKWEQDAKAKKANEHSKDVPDIPDEFDAGDIEAMAKCAEAIYRNLSFYLRGWENFKTENGVAVEFKLRDPQEPGAAPRVSDESLDRLDLMTAMQLNMKLLDHSGLTGRDRKN